MSAVGDLVKVDKVNGSGEPTKFASTPATAAALAILAAIDTAATYDSTNSSLNLSSLQSTVRARLNSIYLAQGGGATNLSGSYDDKSISATSVNGYTFTAATTFTGIEVPAAAGSYNGGTYGPLVVIENKDATYSLTLKANDGASSTANQIDFTADLVLAPKQCAILWHNGTKWKVLAAPGSGGSSGATLAQGKLAGRGGASGSGVYEEIAVTGAATFSTTTLDFWGLGAGRRAITSADTVAATDRGRVIEVTSGTFSLAFTAAATLGAAFMFAVYNSGSGVITLDPNGSETIRDATSSATTKTLSQGQGAIIFCDGSGFFMLTQMGAVSTLTTAGDIEVHNGTAPARMAIGTLAQVRKVRTGQSNKSRYEFVIDPQHEHVDLVTGDFILPASVNSAPYTNPAGFRVWAACNGATGQTFTPVTVDGRPAWEINAGTTANADAKINVGVFGSVQGPYKPGAGKGFVDFYWRSPDVLSGGGAGDTYDIVLSLSDTLDTNNNRVNAFYSTAAGIGGTLLGRSWAAGSGTANTAGATSIAVDTNYVTRIEINSSSDVKTYLRTFNSAFVQQVAFTTNIATGGMFPSVRLFRRTGSASRKIYLYAIHGVFEYDTPR